MTQKTENLLLRRYIEKAMVDLPSLPSVVIAVLEATERDTVTNQELEKLMGADLAIMTKMLKVVNSAYFGLPRQISSVSQAITILGLYQVRNLVLSIGVLNSFGSTSPRVEAVRKGLWAHSLRAALCSQLLAQQRGLSSREQELAFVGGMLHDVGRLFLFTLFNLPYSDVIKESVKHNQPVLEVEKKVLATNHAELGGTLAERWNFPDELVEVIRDHEEPTTDSSPATFAAHLADRLSLSMDETGLLGPAPAMSPVALAWVGATPEGLEPTKAVVAERVKEVNELIGLL